MTKFLYILSFILFSCSIDDNNYSPQNFPEVTYPSHDEFQLLFQNALDQKIQHFQCDAQSGWVNFSSEKGVKLTINTNCLKDENGYSVNGPVQIEFIEIFSKAEMLTTNKPTMGLMSDGINKSILRTGGEFFVSLKQNGNEIFSDCGYTLQIPTSLTEGPSSSMTLWYGSFDENNNLTWEEDDTGENVFIEGGFYFVFLNQFGWCNVDTFVNYPELKTTIYVDVPDGYDNQNSSVYLSYDEDVVNGLACLDVYDENLELFSEHYGQIPVGLQLHVIFITEYNGNYRYAIQAQTIEEDEIITITFAELSIATEAELIHLINELP